MYVVNAAAVAISQRVVGHRKSMWCHRESKMVVGEESVGLAEEDDEFGLDYG